MTTPSFPGGTSEGDQPPARPAPPPPPPPAPYRSDSSALAYYAPNAEPVRRCVVCGGPVVPHEYPIMAKRRQKFGFIWVLICFLTCFVGGFLLWLVMPRQNVIVGIDRYLQCTRCGARQS